MQNPQIDRIVREPERRQITGRSRTAWFYDEQRGQVPRRIKIGARSSGWRLSELQSWVRGEWNPEDAEKVKRIQAGAVAAEVENGGADEGDKEVADED